MPVGQKLSLAVIAGPDSGKTFPVEKPRVVIGRAGSDVELSDAEISRAHAAIEVSDDTVTVFDLESTNGTYVSGDRVESSLLDNYGEFEIGGTTLMLIVTGGD
jgi:S-DNA-T family DNA segregation ATPase FtsK/SpoIIIE